MSGLKGGGGVCGGPGDGGNRSIGDCGCERYRMELSDEDWEWGGASGAVEIAGSPGGEEEGLRVQSLVWSVLSSSM